ncbi:MAG: hypothetical protein ACHQZR_00695, partial [Candidatus Limnocylindrales bacterium]
MSGPEAAAPPDRPRGARRGGAPAVGPAPQPLVGPPVPGLTKRSVAFLLGTVLVLWVVLIFGRAVATAADAAQ